MTGRPQRFGLQAWLVAAFVAVGAIASLAVALVILPTLESSIRADQASRTGADLLVELRDRQFLDPRTARDELSQLAAEIGGDVRLWTVTSAAPALVEPSNANGYLPQGGLSHAGLVVATGAQRRYEAVAVDGRRVIQAAYRADLAGLDAVVEAGVPVRGAEAQIAIFRRRTLLAAAAVLMLAALAGLAVARLLGRRIQGLAGTASTLARGDLTARAADVAPQELTSLGRSLNAMAERLEGLVAETLSDRDRARALVSSLAEGVLAVGDTGEVTVANTSAQRLLGLPSGAESVTIAELPEPVREAVAAGREGRADGPTEARLPGGIEALISVSAASRGAGVVLTLRDVTEEHRLARARRDLIANVSHELKTPLTAIKGFMELLENEELSSERREEFLGLMSQEVARLERLVAEQLELARLDAGAIALELQAVDLGELAGEVAASRRLLAEREGIELIAGPGPVAVSVLADPARIEQILLILLDNAVRHTPIAGKITVAVSTEGRFGTVSVRDTGTGIPYEAQEFVFDRFFQAEASRAGQGIGLGLAIARGLAEAHGGSIDVRSTPQVGTVFTVRLPLGGEAGPHEAERPGAAVSG